MANCGMLINANISYFKKNNYKYILAYKIKNIDTKLKKQISNLTFITDSRVRIIDKEILTQTLLSYKELDSSKILRQTDIKPILEYLTKD